MYKLIESSEDSYDLPNSFHRDIEPRERELTNNKGTKGNFQERIYLKDVFGFAEHQENATCGPGHKSTMHRNSDKNVLGLETI